VADALVRESFDKHPPARGRAVDLELNALGEREVLLG
jgi:hypothetical protein